MKWESMFVFLLGFFSCVLFIFIFGNFNIIHADVSTEMVEVPFVTGLAASVFGGDISAPSDWVSEEDVIVLDDRIILLIKDATLSNYMDSGSMLPVLGEGANGIRVVPKSEEDVDVGDIVSYRFGEILVVHRIVEKGIDEGGVYFAVKGDNNLIGDGKVRFDQIEYVTVAVIY